MRALNCWDSGKVLGDGESRGLKARDECLTMGGSRLREELRSKADEIAVRRLAMDVLVSLFKNVRKPTRKRRKGMRETHRLILL